MRLRRGQFTEGPIAPRRRLSLNGDKGCEGANKLMLEVTVIKDLKEEKVEKSNRAVIAKLH